MSTADPPATARAQPHPMAGAETSAIAQLFARTAVVLSRTLLFDRATLALIESGDELRLLEHAGKEGLEESRGSRAGYSERLWPATGGARFVADATLELDRTLDADRRWLELGTRSLVTVPLRVDQRPVGLLVLASPQAAAFDPARATMMEAVAEFLAIAAERERLLTIEEARHARRMKLEVVLPVIAQSLDIRRVFVEYSAMIKEVLPHDVMAFSLLNDDRTGVHIQAATDGGVIQLPEYRFSSPEEALDANWRFLIAQDVTPIDDASVRVRISPRGAPVVEVVTQPGPGWVQFIRKTGIRASMRVPIRDKDRPMGGVAFMSREPDAYNEEDGIFASRIADHVALALAHQRLAEEERQIALAEERARHLESRVDQLSRELDRFSAHRALGQSGSWKKALADATQVAATDTTVLITGESGTGKEVIARFIHRGSKRAKGSFIALNCAALPEQLLESELFGHERGAFTGATESRAGRIEQASGGVLFLDEVGEMPPAMQAKFLRVLQEREFQRVGGSKTIKADVRIVAATNRDPRAGIASGSFREDLYYRLGVFEIHLPPLRERPEDILVLAEAFLEEVGATIGRPAAGLSEAARDQLLAHSWPGNVRELRNAIERAVILCQGGLVTQEHLPITVARPVAERVAMATAPSPELPVEGLALGDVERELVIQAMAKAGHNKSRAAKLLGLSRGQLYSLLRRHGLTDARR